MSLEQDGRDDVLIWMDKCFFQKCIAIHGFDPQLSVVDVTVESACSSVDSCVSSIRRVSLTLDNENDKEKISLIIKYLPKYCEAPMLPGLTENFKKETLMYSRIMSEIEHILASIGYHEQFSARYYTSGDEPTQYIITEDLVTSGYEMARRTRALDLQHSLLVMRTLAKLHAASAVLFNNDPQLINEIGPCCRYGQETCKRMRPQTIQAGKKLSNLISTFPGIPPDLPARLINFSAVSVDKLQELAVHRPGKFNALLHGDLWINNTMFNYVRDQPSSVRLVDFQESYISTPAIDILYFIYTSTNTDVEVDCLIQEYYTNLEETLSSLKFTGPRYTFQDLKDDLEEYKIFSVYACIFVTLVVYVHEDTDYNLPELVYKDNTDQFEKLMSNPVHHEILKQRLPYILQQNVL